MLNSLSITEIQDLKDVAAGEKSADILLLNGDVVNVCTGEIEINHSIAIKGTRIACVGKNLEYTAGKNTQIFDFAGKTLVPGFIDSHAHLIYASPEQFLRYIMRSGTTTIVTELIEMSYALGFKGILEYLGSLRDQPIKIFATAPCPALLSKSGYKIAPSIDQIKSLLNREDILGLGECYWSFAYENNFFQELAAESLRLGKTVEGHAAGAHGQKLMTYISQGISSCHESTNIEELLERLRQGLFSMIREGSIRTELEAMSGITESDIDTRRIGLVTDGIDPRYLVKKGYLETAIQKAIDLGFDPIKTIQMVTINPATYFHLESFAGSITPCKHADIVVIPNLKKIKAEYVFSKGKIISRGGRLLVQPRKSYFSYHGLKKAIPEIKPEDLMVKSRKTGCIKVKVIDQVSDLVTRELQTYLLAENGEIKADPAKGINKIFLVTTSGKVTNGFVHGFGIKTGAIACSNAWETFGIIAIGNGKTEMANAINEVRSMEGGIAVYSGDNLLAEIALPVGGIITTIAIESIAKKLDQVQRSAMDIGCNFKDALLTMSVLTTSAIPFLRISENGLEDLKNNRVVNLRIAR